MSKSENKVTAKKKVNAVLILLVGVLLILTSVRTSFMAKAVEPDMGMNTMFTYDSTKVTATNNSAVDAKFLNLPNALSFVSTGAQTIAFNGIIKGDFNMKYSITPDGAALAGAQRNTQGISMRFTDAADETNFFDYVLYPNIANADFVNSYVEYKGQKRATANAKPGGVLAAKVYKNDEIFVKGDATGAGTSVFYAGTSDAHFAWKWGKPKDAAYIEYNSAENALYFNNQNAARFLLADFDTITNAEYAPLNLDYGWTTPFAGFSSGYKLSVSLTPQDDRKPKFNIHEFGGISMAADNKPAATTSSFALNGASHVEYPLGDWTDPGATVLTKLEGSDSVNLVQKTVAGVFVEPNGGYDKIGQWTINYTNGDTTLTRTIKVTSSYPVITVENEDKIPSIAKVGASVTLPDASYVKDGETIWEPGAIKVVGPAGSSYETETDVLATKKVTFDRKGAYTITYIGDVTATNPENSKAFTIEVIDKTMDKMFRFSDQVTATSKNVVSKTFLDLPNALSFETTGAQTIGFNGIISGDFAMNYSITPDGETLKKARRNMNKMSIRFTDAVNEDNYFDYVLFPNPANAEYINSYVEYKGQKRSTANAKPTQGLAAKVYKDDEIFVKGLEKDGMSSFYAGISDAHFAWPWGKISDMAYIEYNSAENALYFKNNKADRFLLADFDEITNPEYAALTTPLDYGWTTPFAGFSSGYKVSISLNPESKRNPKLNIHSLAGIDMAQLGAPEVSATGSEFVLVGANAVTVEAGKWTDVGANVITPLVDYANIKMVTENIVGVLEGTTGGLSTVGVWTYKYTKGATVLTRVVTVVDTTKPTIALVGDANVEVVVNSEWTDPSVTYTDNATGDCTITSDKDTVLKLDTIGSYEITYTVTDANENSNTIKRVVVVKEAPDTTPPVFEANIATTGKLGDVVAIPDGSTATDNKEGALTVIMVITAPDGTTVTLTDGKLTLSQTGKYSIVYTITDLSENELVAPYEITVSAAVEPQPEKKGCGSAMATTSSMILVVLSLLFIVVIKNKKSFN